jgi:hypothetical protein
MAQTFSKSTLLQINKKFSQVFQDLTNFGMTVRNLILGNNNVATTNFTGIIIGDGINAREDGIYIGRNVKLTEEGLTFKTVIIDGGLDQAYDLTRTNMIDIIDGVRYSAETDPSYLWKDSPLPITQEKNWGRPIIDGGVVENMVP